MVLSFIILILLMSYNNPKQSFTNSELEEFELLNLCHCHEYLKLRNYDYIKWKSDESKKKHLKEVENTEFGQYSTVRLYDQYYQKKYDSTLFIKNGISIYFGSKLNYSRLDSLYYEPIVRHYVKKQSRTETLPYLGLGDNNFYMDCFYKVKEIPLEKELEYFLRKNHK